MINYSDSYFNLTTLFRVYGSATYKALGFALLSSAIYLVCYYYGGIIEGDDVDGLKQYNLLDHPYPVSVICTAFMFVLSAKVNFCYNRFWEACTALHNMHSKWLDVGSTLAAFHMQSRAYERVQPPSFGDHQDLNNLIMQRSQGSSTMEEKTNRTTHTEKMTEDGFSVDDSRDNNNKKGDKTCTSTFGSYLKKPQSNIPRKRKGGGIELVSIGSTASHTEQLPYPDYQIRMNRIHGIVGTRSHDTDATTKSMSAGERKEAVPSLFLQEAAHLVSLLSAVALSTLRCDSDGAEAPLTEFIPGHHWPNFNSDNDIDMKQYGYKKNNFVATMKYMLDASRTGKERAAYNAARPFPVIGGLSKGEAFMLQKARGSCAKTGLVFMWLNEFIIREQQHGSLGSVAPPIVSRLQQYSSDGHLWYNSARKMAYIPFPFPHTQMATLVVLASSILMPVLMLSKTELWFGLALNFFAVLLFAGLNEISKELEFPFRGMPNDLPLNLFQAQFNEALVTMFSGFHPDSWWEVDGVP